MKVVYILLAFILMGSYACDNSNKEQKHTQEKEPTNEQIVVDELIVEDSAVTIELSDTDIKIELDSLVEPSITKKKKLKEKKTKENLSSVKQDPYKEPEDPSTLPIPKVADPFLLKLLEPETMRLPAIMRHGWPHKPWTHAKAYVYNFVPSGPLRKLSRTPWVSDQYSSDIEQIIDLTQDQVTTALELINRTGGGLITTKCPIFIRHAIVFFNDNEEAVGWMGVCFECTDSYSSPDYFPADIDRPSRYDLYNSYDDSWYEEDDFDDIDEAIEDPDEVRWDVVDLYYEVFDKWKLFFDHLGAKQYKIERN